MVGFVCDGSGGGKSIKVVKFGRGIWFQVWSLFSDIFARVSNTFWSCGGGIFS